ncbi:MAG TPA: hypothetical protein VEB64_18270 [Azospirillaceae bacterium]|nr:hypothetical protein [Azospirillaceae bacterium]
MKHRHLVAIAVVLLLAQAAGGAERQEKRRLAYLEDGVLACADCRGPVLGFVR